MVGGARPERADERAVREAVEGVARAGDGDVAGVAVAVVTDPARVEGLALRVGEALARVAAGGAQRVYR